VQVDLREACLLGQLLEPAGDRVRVWRLAVFPAEQPAKIVVVRPEVAPLLVEQVDVILDHGQGERVER
jgi:hypothetical protein